MNILITGGTGLIGTALIDALISEEHQIFVLTRNPGKAKAHLPPEVITARWDGTSPEGWVHLIDQTDAIINLAGESIAGNSFTEILTRRWTDKQRNRIKQSRLDAGQALIKAIQAASKKPEVLIQSSAVGYYGPCGEDPISESTPAGKDYIAEVCKMWEDSTIEAEAMGIRRAIIRTGLVLASKGGILPMMLLPFRLYVGGPIGSGKQQIPWIHMQDQVDAIRFLLKNEGTQGAYNLSAPNPISNAEFSKAAGQILHRPNWIHLPSFALKLALGEKASLVLDGQRALPQRLLDSGYNFRFDNLETALRDLL